MSLLRKKGKIKADLELISLHIPKTAGTSFRNILKDVYGDSRVARLDIRSEIELNGKVFKGSTLSNKIRVIHGHFKYFRLMNKFEIAPDVPMITWFRDPVERVISNYYYLNNILMGKYGDSEKMVNLFNRMIKTLPQYAEYEGNRNRMSKFLEGTDPERFLFIGLTDHYEEDLEHLAKILNWEGFSIRKQNITGNKPEVEPDIINKIRELNEADCILYEKALKMREDRISLTS